MRFLRRLGRGVEVQNYIDDTGVQVADVVIGFSELEGRDLYVSEGCYTCHSQMIRPFRSETERYGPYSKSRVQP